jgi:hypothetical protein
VVISQTAVADSLPDHSAVQQNAEGNAGGGRHAHAQKRRLKRTLPPWPASLSIIRTCPLRILPCLFLSDETWRRPCLAQSGVRQNTAKYQYLRQATNVRCHFRLFTNVVFSTLIALQFGR